MTTGLAWFVRRKLYAWECRPFPSTDPEAREIVASELVVGVKLPGDMERTALLQGWPEVFLRTSTTWGEPKIAFRMGRIDPQHLEELVMDAWYTQAPKYLRRQFDGEEATDR